jgi:hypothetical protein
MKSSRMLVAASCAVLLLGGAPAAFAQRGGGGHGYGPPRTPPNLRVPIGRPIIGLSPRPLTIGSAAETTPVTDPHSFAAETATRRGGWPPSCRGSRSRVSDDEFRCGYCRGPGNSLSGVT